MNKIDFIEKNNPNYDFYIISKLEKKMANLA